MLSFLACSLIVYPQKALNEMEYSYSWTKNDLRYGVPLFWYNKLSFITTMANIFLPQLFIIVHKLLCLSNTMFIKTSNYGTTATKLFWYDHQSSSMFWGNRSRSSHYDEAAIYDLTVYGAACLSGSRHAVSLLITGLQLLTTLLSVENIPPRTMCLSFIL